MTSEQLARETRYLVSVAPARSMFCRDLISVAEFHVFDRRMIEKYQPLFSGLMAKISVDNPADQR